MRHDDNTTSFEWGKEEAEEEEREREREKRKSVVKGEFVKGATGRESDLGKYANSCDLQRHEIYNLYTYA